MQGLIAVIGVTGTVGSRVAHKLAAKGIAVRGIARDIANAPQHPKIELKQGLKLTYQWYLENQQKNATAIR